MRTKEWQEPKLGDRAKDAVTGFEGIVIGRTEYLNGCIRFGIQPQKVTREGKVADSEWFDEKQLIVTADEAVTVAKKATGGPAITPREERNPR